MNVHVLYTYTQFTLLTLMSVEIKTLFLTVSSCEVWQVESRHFHTRYLERQQDFKTFAISNRLGL
jgi:hypothetical protein